MTPETAGTVTVLALAGGFLGPALVVSAVWSWAVRFVASLGSS